MQYDWVEFYTEFATKLLQFKNSRKYLIEKIYTVYKAIGLSVPTLEENGELVDIDPFTVFGLFNKGITLANRIAIISSIAREFEVKAKIPENFDGIPVLNNLSATFYGFKPNRQDGDIDNLWKLFEAAINLADYDTEDNRQKFSVSYNKVHDQYCIRWNITMGLYWIRPYEFINLDSRNRWYMTDVNNMPSDFVVAIKKKLKKVPYADDYLKIIDMCRDVLASGEYEYETFPDLSYTAWIISEKVNKEQAAVQKNAFPDKDVKTIRYWLYSPGSGAEKWEECYKNGYMLIGWGEIGNLAIFASKDEMKQQMKQVYGNDSSYKNSAHATWQFIHEVMPGDVIFAKKGNNTLLGKGVIESDYEYDEERNDGYCNFRKVKWTNKGEWKIKHQLPQKTLTDITPYNDLIQEIKDLLNKNDDVEDEEREICYPVYTEADFLKDVFMSATEYNQLVGILRKKKNIILQGAPGVGKTYAAKRLAYSMMGVKDVERVMMVQFHQSYSYEDFIMGFRPAENGFELKKGAFYKFCKKAETDLDNDYFFIIDEINRGNLSKIFGELFMLIENDKRGIALQLLYSDERFAVPGNVYIIGMMNTADRSLAMLDYALRRRFAFFELKPGFETEGFLEYKLALDNVKFNRLISCVEELNQTIIVDESLGEGFCLGHSYFCNLQSDQIDEQCLYGIVEYEIIPLLKEYWFDEPVKVQEWSERLRSTLK